MARDYLRVIFIGLPFSMLGVLIQMSLRGAGDSITPLWFMILSVAIDSGFNPLLIDGSVRSRSWVLPVPPPRRCWPAWFRRWDC